MADAVKEDVQAVHGEIVETSATALKVVVDVSRLTIGDIAMFDEIRQERKEAEKRGEKSEFPISRFVDFLDRVVEGGVRQYPFTSFEAITMAVMAEIDSVTSKATAGNSLSG